MLRLIDNEKLTKKNKTIYFPALVLSCQEIRSKFPFPCKVNIYWNSLHLFLSERACSCTSLTLIVVVLQRLLWLS